MSSSPVPAAPAARVAKGRRNSGRAQNAALVDPYRRPGKLAEPALCPQCRAVYSQGRWRWQDPPPKAAVEVVCQACHRIKDDFPAGRITLSGLFVAEHMDDLILLADRQGEAESGEHPLNRIIAITPVAPDRLEISTTDIHLPGRIGKAVQRAYDGVLEEHFAEDDYFVRVTWRRD